MKKIAILIFFASLQILWGESLSLWHAYTGEERKALEELAKKYEEKNGVKINLLAIPFDAFDKKLTASIPRGQGPDVFIYANDNIGKWVESDFLETLDYWMVDGTLDQLIKSTVLAMVYKKNIYALPLAFKVPVLYYNKKYISSVPNSFDELIEISKKLMGENKNIFGFAYENTNLFFHSFIHFGFNASLFDDDKKVKIGEQQSIDAMNFAKKMALETGIMPKSIDSALITTLFNKNELLFVVNGPWFMGDISKNISYGIAPIPLIDGNTPKPYMSIEGILMSKYSKKKESAMKFIKFIVSDESSEFRMRKGMQAVATKSTYQKENINPNFVVFQKQAENATPLSNNPLMSFFWAPMGQALKKVINEKYDSAKALSESKEELEKLLEK
ncbi:extracellular solute-binding protein [bacterium]|nr:extracellular solute-binding protein [bacterium]